MKTIENNSLRLTDKEKKVTLETTNDDSLKISQSFITIIIPIPHKIGFLGITKNKRNPTAPPIKVPNTLCEPILKDVFIVSCIVTTQAVAA